MYSPLLDGVISRYTYPVVGLEDHREIASAHRHGVLFFSGDWERLGESNDVAVILPELAAAFQGVFQPLVVDRGCERKLQAIYRFSAFPALVFLRDGEYLGVITRVLDWDDYLRETARILSLDVSTPPPFPMPGARAAAKDDDHDHGHGHFH
ncbi:hydrogenase-1 expression HyaE [Mesorhizobium sp. ArgA1]